MLSHPMLPEDVCLQIGIQRATWLSLKVGLKAQASMHMPLVRIPQRPAVCWEAGEGIAVGGKRGRQCGCRCRMVFSSRFSELGIDIFFLFHSILQMVSWLRQTMHPFFPLNQAKCICVSHGRTHACRSIPITFSRPTPSGWPKTCTQVRIQGIFLDARSLIRERTKRSHSRVPRVFN